MKKIFLTLIMGLFAINMANSQIVYTDLTDNPINVTSEYALNLLGKEVFMIQNYSAEGEYVYFACFEPGSAVVATPTDYNANVNALMEGTEIGSNSNFWGYDDNGNTVAFDILCLPGEFNYADVISYGKPYVGFKFKGTGANIHYGWAQIDIVENSNGATVTLNGYAYQSTPNTPIKAGDKGYSSLLNTQSENISVSIYPNPASEMVNINSTKQVDKVEIYNALGQIVLSDVANNNVNISSLNKGVYYMTVVVENEIVTTKFVKR